jgi:hypothetical protein
MLAVERLIHGRDDGKFLAAFGAALPMRQCSQFFTGLSRLDRILPAAQPHVEMNGSRK